jgi:hypothetical protein
MMFLTKAETCSKRYNLYNVVTDGLYFLFCCSCFITTGCTDKDRDMLSAPQVCINFLKNRICSKTSLLRIWCEDVTQQRRKKERENPLLMNESSAFFTKKEIILLYRRCLSVRPLPSIGDQNLSYFYKFGTGVVYKT